MWFEPQLIEGRLVRRYKRFLADVALGDGRVVTAHCPNTGSMLGCDAPGSRVWLSVAANPRRKYAHTWELVEAAGALVGINTARTNHLVREAVAAGRIAPLAGYARLRAEVRFGSEGSRVDFVLDGAGDPGPAAPPCFLEVKNVTAAVDAGVALFPDAVTVRGRKHLRELQAMAAAGARAVLLFCVQRGDVAQVRPADRIDPAYGAALREAAAAGVEVYAYGAEISPRGVCLARELPVVLDGG